MGIIQALDRIPTRTAVLFLVGLIVLIVGFATYQIATKPAALFGDILDYRNAEFHKYEGEYFKGIPIPNETEVYFVSNVTAIAYFRDLFNEYKGTRIGTFRSKAKQILVLEDLPTHRKKESIIHEISHFQYDYQLSDSQLEVIESRYNQVCESPTEFYAYTVAEGQKYRDGFYGFYSFNQRQEKNRIEILFKFGGEKE